MSEFIPEAFKHFNHRTTTEELVAVYKTAAANYDQVLLQVDYTAPENASKALSNAANERNMSKTIRILDAGAGTGLAGECLQRLGFSNLDALDVSPEMLELAKLKRVDGQSIYKNFYQASLTEELDIETDTYDSAILVGTYSVGEPLGKSIPEMVRIVKTAGLICFTIRNCVLYDSEYDYKEIMQTLIDEKKWKLLTSTQVDYMTTAKCSLFIYEVL